MQYQYYNSKRLTDSKSYNLLDSQQRALYFQSKLGSKIDDVKEFLKKRTFTGYMLAKKMGGKSIYGKMIEEILEPDNFCHISVGDVIRKTHDSLKKHDSNSVSLIGYLEKNYRGSLSLDKALESLFHRTNNKLSIPLELVLYLLKYEVEQYGKNGLFIDGFPRNTEQISSSLFFKNFIDRNSDPDFFVLIEVPEEIIDLRIKKRVICPLCQTSRNLLTSPTKFIGFDDSSQEYYLLCDNENCAGYSKERYVEKEGDKEGKKLIEERIQADGTLLDIAGSVHGIDKVFVKSSYPLTVAYDYLEEYEIQPVFDYIRDGDQISKVTRPWVFKDDSGEECCTMFAATYVLSIFDQLHSILFES